MDNKKKRSRRGARPAVSFLTYPDLKKKSWVGKKGEKKKTKEGKKPSKKKDTKTVRGRSKKRE